MIRVRSTSILKNAKGHSLIEMAIVAGLISLVMAIAFYFFNGATIAQVIATNNEIRTAVIKQINDHLAAAMSAPGVKSFNPALTLQNPDALTFAGTWEVSRLGETPPTEVTTSAGVSSELLGTTSFTQDSHTIIAYRMITKPDGKVERMNLYALLSRCVDALATAYPTTLIQVKALKKPVWINGAVQCCDDAGTCPDSSSGEQRYWPTIFVYKNNTIPMRSIPSEKEREIVPGAGFMVNFNRRLDPDSAKYTAFILENRCKTTTVGYKDRAPVKCAVTVLGKPAIDPNFGTDVLPYSLMQQSKPLTSDVSGSGFIKL